MLLLALSALTAPALALDPPAFSVQRGVHDASFTLELAAEDGATILYTAGPGEPDQPWPGSLEVDTTTIVRAVAVGADGEVSATATHTYLWIDQVLTTDVMDPGIVDDPIYGPVLEDTLRTLPTISLVLDGEPSTTEQRTSMEWIDPDGDVIQLDCGVRAVGGHSLNYDKNNLRLYFRGEYGAGRLELGLYDEAPYNTGVPPADEHDALNLRGGSHDSVFYLGERGQYLRNQWMDETQLAMGHLAPHNRWAHVYVDAEYIGIYQVRERFDAAFLAEYLGGDEDDYEAINGGTAIDGDGGAWARVVALRSDYEAVQDWLNVENFVDYMVLNFYAANDWDWNPSQNWMAAGPDTAGAGGFVFHSSDSDICMYYDWDWNLLHEPGPDYVFEYLMAESHPDFRVLLADRIFAALEEDGPLSADVAGARYDNLAERLEDVVVAESARWGQGWWDRDDEWVAERASLVEGWFPRRTQALLDDFREAGWYPLDAPDVSVSPGTVPALTAVEFTAPADFPDAEVWVRTDGGDPRLPGGAVAPEAWGGSARELLTLDRSAWVQARLRDGDTWGPLRRGLYEVDEAPALVLNEWNAVAEDRTLADGDTALGTLTGNGGDWIELVVVEDHLDLRGWRLVMEDRGGDAGTLAFTDHEVLADLRAGTLLTIAEDLPQDLAYDPEAGDWRFHLRAGSGGDGSVVSATPFDVAHREWQLTVFDAEGFVAFGPVGEGVAPGSGISGSEVGALQDTPGAHTRRGDDAYDDADHSSFGAPNTWADGAQDLSALRAVVTGGDTGDSGTSDTGSHDTASPQDSGTPDSGTPDSGTPDGSTPDSGTPDSGTPPADPACGCATGGAGGGLLAALIPLLALRRRRLVLLAGLAACTPSKPSDSGAPGDGGSSDSGTSDGGTTDSGATDSGTTDSGTTDSGSTDGGSTTGPSDCLLDEDGDGFGGDELTDCETGVEVGGDCDDADPSVFPGAPETCDGDDEDCDGDVDEDPVDGLPFYADADGDGWGSNELVTACALADGVALVDGDCDDADPDVHPEAPEACDGIDQDCDGSSEDGRGVSEECPGESCQALLDAGDTTDGAYWIELADGTATPVWCDQSTDGGGWTLGFLRNTVGTGSQGDFGAGYVDVEGLDLSDEEASASAESRRAWQDLNLLDWSELRLTAAQDGDRTYASAAISRDSLRLSFGEDGYLLYGEEGYYWCGGDATYTDDGVGAVDNPDGATADCRGHGSLGSGWDFSDSLTVNQGLTLCGGDGSSFLSAGWGGPWVYYGGVGGAQAIWVR